MVSLNIKGGFRDDYIMIIYLDNMVNQELFETIQMIKYSTIIDA